MPALPFRARGPWAIPSTDWQRLPMPTSMLSSHRRPFTWPSTCAIPTEFPMSSASPWVRRHGRLAGSLKTGDSSYVTGLTGEEEYVKAQYALADLNAWKTEQAYDDTPCDVLVIGEPVYLQSMKAFLQDEMGVEKVRLLCPLSDAPQWLLKDMEVASVEAVIRQECRKRGGSLPIRFMPACCRMNRVNLFLCLMKPIPAVIIMKICRFLSARPLRHG